MSTRIHNEEMKNYHWHPIEMSVIKQEKSSNLLSNDLSVEGVSLYLKRKDYGMVVKKTNIFNLMI